jgi:hypothetical protein
MATNEHESNQLLFIPFDSWLIHILQGKHVPTGVLACTRPLLHSPVIAMLFGNIPMTLSAMLDGT